MREVVIP